MARWAEWFGKRQDLAFVLAVLAILGTIIVPVPPFVLDCLLVASITASVLILLTVVYVREPVRFSVFPAVLLLSTAYRLALNVAATRQILGNAGDEGTRAAGRVIEAFGNFVAGNEPAIGFVIFAILVAVNFIVITKGSGRVSEVAARFTLDALPGKQMAIDADLNAGLIKEDEARRRREQVAREADFYGAMDGASKFVRGDAAAGILITLINIAAGFAIGWLKYGMSASDALYTFTILTIGDGLVSQVPALIVSLAAGLLVTRAGAEASLGRDVVGQVLGEGRALRVAAAFLGALLLTAVFLGSGLPILPLALALAAVLLVAAGTDAAARGRARVEAARREREAPAPPKPERVESLLRVEPLELEVGYALLGLVDPAKGGKLLDHVAQLRRQTAAEMGVVVPPVTTRDNLKLEPAGYVLKIRGVPVARGTLVPDRVLAMDSGSAAGPLEGIAAREPAFGLSAWWIPPDQAEAARAQGYSVTDAAAVLATHLTEVVRQHAHELLTRDEVQNLLKTLKETRPAVVEEVVPGLMKPGEVQKVLQNLLREGVSIRDLGTILETLGDVAPRSKDPEVLTEYVRNALARTICLRHVAKDGKIYVITLDPKLEDLIRSATERTERGATLGLTPALLGRLADRLRREIDRLTAAGHAPVVLCSPPVRAQVKRIADAVQPGVAVLSYNEIVREVKVESLGMVAVEA
jgi:flagellar biosynthesis protein FlhA